MSCPSASTWVANEWRKGGNWCVWQSGPVSGFPDGALARKSGRVVGIAVPDHVVVGDDRHVSLRERGRWQRIQGSPLADPQDFNDCRLGLAPVSPATGGHFHPLLVEVSP